MNLKLCLILSISLTINNVSSEEDNDLIVKINSGKLKGKDNGYYYSYESIPYAEPPVGELRFESPQPYQQKWSEIFEATKKPIKCMQWDQYQEGEYKLVGEEDCLAINVYKPKTGMAKYPVLVYIHGGAFMFGAANAYGEDYLMKSGKVMLVTMSYRLGPLGFLSTEDEIITGNFGLKDQQLALKWIKENISQFGGDPENIVIAGFSAGGASAHLHMLNPYLKDIAKGAISLSGVALNPWVIITKSLYNTQKLAQYLQCPDVNNSQEIKNCLKNKTAKEIVETVKKFLNIGYNPFTTFGPVVEHPNSVNAFITQHPRDIIKSGNYAQIPWLASYSAQDGGYNAAGLLQINSETGKPILNDLNNKWLELAPQNLFLHNINNSPVDYARELKDKYLGNQTFSEENYLKVQELYTDVLFKNGVLEAIKLHSLHKDSPVYGYVYDNPADFGFGHGLAQRKDIELGTVHGDDFTLMLSFPTHHLRSDEELISQKFIKMLNDFVATRVLTFGECHFENNAGNSEQAKMLLISKDSCKNIIF